MCNKNFFRRVCLALLTAGIIFTGCSKDDPPPKASNFTSPAEIVSNPSVAKALNDAGVSVYDGNTPPLNLAGEYSTDGIVVNSSDGLSEMIGRTFQSTFILSNQSSSGTIDFTEKVQGITAAGSGGYITGKDGNFTIYQESKQSGLEAGLPPGISVTVVLIMSGTKANNGNLTNMKGISIFTEVNNRSYNLIIGQWWQWAASFYLVE